MNNRIGFLGAGNLGRPIAGNLLQRGYALSVFNRDRSKIEALVENGAVAAERPADAAQPGGVVLSLLWDDASVDGVVNSPDFLARLGAGGVHVSMTTLSPEGSKRLAALHARHGVGFVEAPVFGRPEAAAERALSIVMAGAEDAKQRVRPILEAAGARQLYDFGTQLGAALGVKLIGNMLIIAAGTAMEEGLGLARDMGLDPAAVCAMLTDTLFPAPIYRSYGQRIAAGQPAFGDSAIPGKDLALFSQAARETGSRSGLADDLARRR